MNRKRNSQWRLGIHSLASALIVLLVTPVLLVKPNSAAGYTNELPDNDGNPKPDIFDTGIALLDQGKWTEALPIYQQLTKSHPFYAFGWLGLGWSLHYTGQYSEAIPAYRKAIELGAERSYRMMLEIARCYAAMGKKSDALSWFEKAMQNGLTNFARLRDDKTLELLRNEPRFRELVAIVDTSKMMRNEGWRYDLKLLSREIKRVHYNPYRYFSPAEFDKTVKEIDDAIPSLTDDEITVRMMKLARRLGDGHSYAEPTYQQDETQQALPLLLAFFAEGLHVTASAPEHEDLLWARILKFDDAPVESVYKALDEVVAQDNSMRLLAKAPEFMRFPQLLRALGLVKDSSKVNLTIVDRHGQERIVSLTIASTNQINWVRRPVDSKGELPLFVGNRKDL